MAKKTTNTTRKAMKQAQKAVKKAAKKTARKAATKTVKKTPKKTRRVKKKTAMRAARRSAAGAVARIGACLDLVSAGEIVQAAIPGGPHDIDSTLEDAGLISAAERTIFREDVVRGVRDRGCSIGPDDVPNGATTTLREVRAAIHDAIQDPGGTEGDE